MKLFLSLMAYTLGTYFLSAQTLTDYVNPFIGTSNSGNTIIGASSPWGMVSVSPHNVVREEESYIATTYELGRPYLYGFGHVHLSGVGCPDLDSIILMPLAKKIDLPINYQKYKSAYQNEKAEAGFYSVLLNPSGIQTEMTATTAYQDAQECLEFLRNVPTVWDETISLEGKIGELAVMARKKDEQWYLGAITNWKAKQINIDFQFLETNTTYEAAIWQDGINANRNSEDYRMIKKNISSTDQLTFSLASGGGLVIQLFPQKK